MVPDGDNTKRHAGADSNVEIQASCIPSGQCTVTCVGNWRKESIILHRNTPEGNSRKHAIV